MKTGFIGAGKVGVSLGRYFTDNGLDISGYFSRKRESAASAADFTKSAVFDSLGDILSSSDIIFITTPDDIISHIWCLLSEFHITDKIICHCSGSLSSDVFSGIGSLGAYGCSVHPMLAFDSRLSSYKKIHNAFFTLEGSNTALAEIKKILDSTGNKYKIISAENKVKYHLACCFVSNFSVALSKIGLDLLNECGFDSETALSSLSPLMLGNINNISERGIIGALTGPIERNDIGTAEKHLSVLKDNNITLYKLLSSILIEIGEEKNKSTDYTLLKKLMEAEK